MPNAIVFRKYSNNSGGSGSSIRSTRNTVKLYTQNQLSSSSSSSSSGAASIVVVVFARLFFFSLSLKGILFILQINYFIQKKNFKVILHKIFTSLEMRRGGAQQWSKQGVGDGLTDGGGAEEVELADAEVKIHQI